MRRIWIMLLVVAVALVLTVPAGAAKPDRPPKPPKAVPIAVSIDAVPVWVHEGADLIRYTVTVENKTSGEIDGVEVVFTAADRVSNESVGTLPANDRETVGFSRHVAEFPEAAACGFGEECPLPATALALGDGIPATQAEMSTPLMPDPPCNLGESGPALVDDVCIWTLPRTADGVTQTGVWEITLEPTPPRNPNRRISATVSVRDGVPGNWCTLAIGTSSTFGGRWKLGDPPIVGRVYLPGGENLPDLEVGQCLGGGAGGDYFAVGNPDSFYLRASGTVTVEWIRNLP